MRNAIAAAALVLSLSPGHAQLSDDAKGVPKVEMETETIEGKPIDISKAPTGAELGTLKSQKTSCDYKVTADDALWLARMIHAETSGDAQYSDAEAMLWSIAQRRCWGFRNWTLARLVQKYSQPVNTDWLRDGPHCKKYTDEETKALEKSHGCAAHRFKDREKYVTLGWTSLSKFARTSVLGWAQNKTVNTLPGSIGWFNNSHWNNADKNKNDKIDAAENKGFHDFEKPVKLKVIRRNTFYASEREGALDTTKWSAGDTTVDY